MLSGRVGTPHCWGIPPSDPYVSLSTHTAQPKRSVLERHILTVYVACLCWAQWLWRNRRLLNALVPPAVVGTKWSILDLF